MRYNKLLPKISLAVLSLLSTTHVQAVELGGIDFTGSGFMTLAAGKVLNSSTPANAQGYNCPCSISDYSNGGIYENSSLNFLPDSKLGLQGTASFNNSYSVTAQIMSRGAKNGNVNLEWLYATMRLNNNLSVQVGRKRLPLSYYSETQDIGQSYPWVHLPPQAYGWETVNYNGASLTYEDQWGDWSSSLNLITGSETVKDNGFWKLYTGKTTRTDTRWSKMYGVNLILNREWFETRLIHLQADTQMSNWPSLVMTNTSKLKMYGISFMADYENWVVRSEFMYNNRKDLWDDHVKLYGVGYRLGKFLPMVTYASYGQSYSPSYVQNLAIDPLSEEAHTATSLLLRYSLTSSSDLKLQYERWQNKAHPQYFTTNPGYSPIFRGASLLSASYDIAF